MRHQHGSADFPATPGPSGRPRGGRPLGREGERAGSAIHENALDRIRIDRTHIAGSINPVNPVYINKVEQIHAVDGIADGDSNPPRSALVSGEDEGGILA